MGFRHEETACVNRAPIAISVTFDGQEITVQPGPCSLPTICIPFGKNQNPIMGSVDHTNPHMSGGDYLLGVVGEDNCEPLTKKEWEAHLTAPSRVNEQAAFEDRYGGDPKARLVLMGKGNKTFAKSRGEVGGTPKGTADFLREQQA
jgi:hypothetical protein